VWRISSFTPSEVLTDMAGTGKEEFFYERTSKRKVFGENESEGAENPIRTATPNSPGNCRRIEKPKRRDCFLDGGSSCRNGKRSAIQHRLLGYLGELSCEVHIFLAQFPPALNPYREENVNPNPVSFQTLLQQLREGTPITVEISPTFSRTLFYENGNYHEQTPGGRKKISLEEAQGYLRIMIARWRRERREHQGGKRKA